MFQPDHQIKSFRLCKGKTSIFQIGLVLIVALFFIGLVWWINKRNDNNLVERNLVTSEDIQKRNEIERNIITPEIVHALSGQLDENFPERVPLEGKIKILESYSAVYPNSTVKQSVVSFESSKTAKENYDFYKKWAEENVWELLNSETKPDNFFLYIRKNKEDLSIIAENDIVIISYNNF